MLFLLQRSHDGLGQTQLIVPLFVAVNSPGQQTAGRKYGLQLSFVCIQIRRRKSFLFRIPRVLVPEQSSHRFLTDSTACNLYHCSTNLHAAHDLLLALIRDIVQTKPIFRASNNFFDRRRPGERCSKRGPEGGRKNMDTGFYPDFYGEFSVLSRISDAYPDIAAVRP